MTVINIEGKKVRVSDDFVNLTPEQQERTVEEIASQLRLKPRDSFMGQVNKGIAESVGGLVDFLNPFDDEVWQGTAVGMGSAQTAIEGGMEAIGAGVAQGEPDTITGGFARGLGRAAGAAPTATVGAQALSRVPGAVGAAADDAYRALASGRGVATEALAGGISGAAEETAEQMGAPEWAQDTAAIAAPMSIPAAASGLRFGGQVAQRMPVSGAIIKGGRSVVRSLAPMSETGAREVARQRVHDLAGGEERAAELGRRVATDDVIGRTPAQQTGDENLLGLERAVADENPNIREALKARREASQSSAQDQIADMGGDVAETRRFFDQRLSEHRASMQARVDRVLAGGDNAISATAPRNTETANSTRVVESLRGELDSATAVERGLWADVPKDVQVSPSNGRDVARRWDEELGRAGRSDMPPLARALLLEETGYSEQETAREVHRLYSKLRETARNARAGTQTQPTLAKVADEIADALLVDLDATSAPTTELGRALNDARAFTRAVNETFDQGAVGRILRRTNAGDEQIAPEAALARTVGRGGAQGVADDASIRNAASQTEGDIADYLRGRFASSVIKPTGEFNRSGALAWLRDNRELLNRYPELRDELRQALSSRDAAATFAARAEVRAQAADRSAVAEFGRGQDQNAVLSILGADDPAKAARSVVATARKDASGEALAGVKGAFTDYLIGKAGTADGLSGAKVRALLSDRNVQSAMRQVFAPDEVRRLRQIGDALASLDANAADVGGVIDTPGNRIIDYVVRTQAARLGGQAGGGSMGGSLQTANIAVERARTILRGLTNDRARQMLMDAVQDPALMRALLLEPKSVNIPTAARSKLAPYLAGGTASAQPLQIEIGGE